jgi:hypothetical protein
MPRLRLLAEGSVSPASNPALVDPSGAYIFEVAFGDVVPIVLDATGYAGGATVSTSVWSSPDGVTLTNPALTSPVASVLASVPGAGQLTFSNGYRVDNAMTLANGQVRNTRIWLRAVRAST